MSIQQRSKARRPPIHVQLLMVNRMLYEFHRQQNGKKPGTVHATYLISGTKQVEEPEATIAVKKDGEDEIMQSSPFQSSMPHSYDGTGASSTLTITLAREEDLDRTTYSRLQDSKR